MTPALTKQMIGENEGVFSVGSTKYKTIAETFILPLEQPVIGTSGDCVYDIGDAILIGASAGVYSTATYIMVNKTTGAAVRYTLPFQSYLITQIYTLGPSYILAYDLNAKQLVILNVSPASISVYIRYNQTLDQYGPGQPANVSIGKKWIGMYNYSYAFSLTSSTVVSVSSMNSDSMFLGDYWIRAASSTTGSILVYYKNLISGGGTGSRTVTVSGAENDTIRDPYLMCVDNDKGYIQGQYTTNSVQKSLTIRSITSASTNGKTVAIDYNHGWNSYNYISGWLGYKNIVQQLTSDGFGTTRSITLSQLSIPTIMTIGNEWAIFFETYSTPISAICAFNLATGAVKYLSTSSYNLSDFHPGMLRMRGPISSGSSAIMPTIFMKSEGSADMICSLMYNISQPTFNAIAQKR